MCIVRLMISSKEFASRLAGFVSFALVSLWSPLTIASETEIEKRAERECGTCHGARGLSEKPLIPSIGGFSENAILDLLTTYENDLRVARRVQLDDGTESDMIQVIESIAQTELEEIALYYSQQEWAPIAQPYDPESAAEGARLHKVKCNKCHINGGSVQESDHALMAGQWREYLEGEFRNFDDGSRKMSSKMQQKYESLNAEGKQAIIEFYVSAGNF